MDTITLNHNDVLSILPDRDPNAHKGAFGRILLLCGSRGYTGAAALAALGSLRSGAGLVYLAVPDSIYEIEASKLTEAIVIPLPDKNGMFSANAVPYVLDMIPKMDAVLVGPGLGRSSGVTEIVLTILKEFMGPVVLDADGINVISEHMDVLRERTSPTILTPHEGEFSRMGGDLSDGRIPAAVNFAKGVRKIVLLKGHRTVITDGDTVYINNTGNPGMAVGGSGDLLSGIIVSLLGQGISPLESAAVGAWVHGRAGDICASEIGQYGMLPSDMAKVLPRLLK